MRTFCTILLLLALIAPGTTIAEPAYLPDVSFWESLLGWFVESLEGRFTSDYEATAGSSSPTIDSLTDPLDGSDNGQPDVDGAVDPGGQEVEESSLPEIGGSLDPYG